MVSIHYWNSLEVPLCFREAKLSSGWEQPPNTHIFQCHHGNEENEHVVLSGQADTKRQGDKRGRRDSVPGNEEESTPSLNTGLYVMGNVVALIVGAGDSKVFIFFCTPFTWY